MTDRSVHEYRYERPGRERYKGMVAGFIGAAAGLAAMGWYFSRVAPAVSDALPERCQALPAPGAFKRHLESIAVTGRLDREGESATAVLGRLAYRSLAGAEPQSDETLQTLSELVHWGYGLSQGALYGAARVDAPGCDLKGGLVFGAALWAAGDELAVPLLGLQGGPASVSPAQHLNRLGAHLAYGLVTAATTQILRRIL